MIVSMKRIFMGTGITGPSATPSARTPWPGTAVPTSAAGRPTTAFPLRPPGPGGACPAPSNTRTAGPCTGGSREPTTAEARSSGRRTTRTVAYGPCDPLRHQRLGQQHETRIVHDRIEDREARVHRGRGPPAVYFRYAHLIPAKPRPTLMATPVTPRHRPKTRDGRWFVGAWITVLSAHVTVPTRIG